MFKSERKQAKFSFWYSKAKEDLVRISFDKVDEANNFKLVSGQGELNCNEPIVDELFGLRIQNAVRIDRTVEVISYEQKRKEEPLKALPCDRNQDLEDEEVDPDLVNTIHYALRWKEIR